MTKGSVHQVDPCLNLSTHNNSRRSTYITITKITQKKKKKKQNNKKKQKKQKKKKKKSPNHVRKKLEMAQLNFKNTENTMAH